MTTETLPAKVCVVDLDMPFWSMVVFMLKWAIATIPALFILFVAGAIATGILSGIVTGLR